MTILRFFVAAAILSITAAFTAHAQADNSPVKVQYGEFFYVKDPSIPGWAKPQKAPRAKGKAKGLSAEYALVDRQLLSTRDTQESFSNTSVYLHTSNAVAEQSEVKLSFDPSYQELVLHEITLVRDKKRLPQLNNANIRLIQREEDLRNGIYDGAVTLVAFVPDSRIGDRIDVSYTLRGRNPVFGNTLFGSFATGWTVPASLINIRLLVPREITIQTRAHNNDIKPKIARAGDLTEYRWRIKSSPAVKDEGNYPAWFQRYPWVEFSEFSSWQEVEAWALSLYDSLEQESPAFNKLSRSIGKNAKNKRDLARAALTFSQDEVRYLGLEFGQNSHLPRPPKDVLENRYGDCKDKSNLLVQLLRSHNIEAYPALVSHQYRQGFKAFLPSPAAFDHVIVKAVIDGTIYWFDPTKTFQGSELEHSGFTPFGKALVVGDKNDEALADVKPLDTQQDTISSTEHFSLEKNSSSAQLNIKTVYQGTPAEMQRYVFTVSNVQELTDAYQNYYAKIYNNITPIKKVSYDDDRVANRFTITESYRIPKFIEAEDGVGRISHYATAIGQNIVTPETRLRDTPIYIGDPKIVRQKILVDFKNDIKLPIDSAPITHKLAAVDFVSRNAYYSNRFEFDSELVIKRDAVSGDELTDYLALLKTIREETDFRLSFVYPPQKDDGKRISNLVNSLKTLKK